MKPLVAIIGAFLPYPWSLIFHLYNILISDTLDSDRIDVRIYHEVHVCMAHKFV